MRTAKPGSGKKRNRCLRAQEPQQRGGLPAQMDEGDWHCQPEQQERWTPITVTAQLDSQPTGRNARPLDQLVVPEADDHDARSKGRGP